jgi:hypothetical protein
MPESEPPIIPALKPFDFTPALALPINRRFLESVEAAQEILDMTSFAEFMVGPCIPPRGASEAELAALEGRLGVPLPAEYRQFLAFKRYLKIGEGWEIGGFAHSTGVFIAQNPWMELKRVPGRRLLTFAHFGEFTFDDFLAFDLSDPAQPVVALLWEHRCTLPYAETFSLALWRLTHEVEFVDAEDPPPAMIAGDDE